MIEITKDAEEQIAKAFQEQPDKFALRLEAKTNGTSEFSYSMKLIREDETLPDDTHVKSGAVALVIDPQSARFLNGATVDYEDRIVRSGFKFINSNKPETPQIGAGPRPDLTGPLAERVQRLIDTELNPAVAAHGGRMDLLGVRDSKVYLSFGGGCHGCGMVDLTLKEGVEARIKEVVPEIQEVVDNTDHSSGQDPYYK